MPIRKIFTLFILSIVLFSSCEIINPEEEIPSYIHIDKFNLSTTTSQGTNSHNITDAWVYIDGNFNGVYELPVTFPVLSSGKHEITLSPGIKIYGIAASREIYPFYKKFKIDADLVPKQVDTLQPIVYYLDELNFGELWMEDFEDAGMKLDTTLGSKANIVQFNDNSYNSKVGHINLTTTKNYFDCISEDLDLPKYSQRVYLEMNYKCNNEFYIGLWANSSSQSVRQPIILLNQSSSWNKIYIDLTQTTTSNPSASSFSLYISATINEANQESDIYIDNLKIIHF